MIKKILSLFLGLSIATITFAQQSQQLYTDNQNQIDLEFKGGFSLGGTAPMSIPREIRHIDHYSPDFGHSYLLEVQLTKWYSNRWGFSTGLRYDAKAMNTTARVKAYKTEIINHGEKVAGYWTGRVNTNVNIQYLTLPLLTSYRINNRLKVQGGFYFSYKLSGEFDGKVSEGYLRENNPTGQKISFVENQYATYNFGSDLRRIAYGVELSSTWKSTSHLSFIAHLSWGLSDIFKDTFDTVTFKMYPVYLTLGVAYQL